MNDNHKDRTTKEVAKRKPSTRRISTRDRGPSRKEILKRDRKQIERYTAMLSMATNIHNDKCSRLNISTSTALAKFAYLSVIDGQQINDTHPLAYAAGGQGPNPNILNHEGCGFERIRSIYGRRD